jgi:putative tryptophan/tyrosine transport system substrate-binding protein
VFGLLILLKPFGEITKLRRREFIAGLGAACWPFDLHAQGPTPARRIGLLLGFPKADPLMPANMAALRDGLKAVGLEEGRNIGIEDRWPGIDAEMTRAFAKELIALKPDVIVASTNQVVSILMQETQTIPIVFVFIGDPIGSRYAETLARPGKNLTGFANFEAPIGGKWLELLKEVAPQTKRVGYVYHPAASPHREFLEVIRSTAPSFGLELAAIPVTSRAEIERDMAAFGGAGSDGGIVVAPHALTLGASDVITELATRYRLPGVYGDRIFSQRGGLLSFGINPPDQLRRAGGYVRRILDGEKPGDLPVQLPVKYEMIINMKTANALGLTPPSSLLARADDIIE